jgi:hypothetical protein
MGDEWDGVEMSRGNGGVFEYFEYSKALTI